MKKKLLKLSVLILSITLFNSCNKDDNDVSPNNSSDLLKKGTWRITFYINSGKDETGDFSGYGFSFNNSGNVTANNGTNNVSGVWGTRKDDGKTKLDLNFGNTAKFESLNDDWIVLKQSSNTIELEDISGGNGGIDKLTFSKN